MSNGLNSFYTANMVNLPVWVLIEAFFLVTPIGGSYRSSVIGLFSFLFIMTIGFLYVYIKAVTKPNRVWEETKMQLLSDAKIHHAQVKLGLYYILIFFIFYIKILFFFLIISKLYMSKRTFYI